MKQVMLSFSGRNKIVKLPDTEQDVLYLKRQFKQLFNFLDKNIVVTLQRFDPDWDSYIDLDDEEAIIDNKETIKVVAHPVSPPSIEVGHFM